MTVPGEHDLDEPADLPLSIEALTETPGYGGQMEHRETIPAREGRYVAPEGVLPPALARAFQDHVGDLYTHQAAGLRHLADGENVVVTTDTASGKTYVYALEIARRRACRFRTPRRLRVAGASPGLRSSSIRTRIFRSAWCRMSI